MVYYTYGKGAVTSPFPATRLGLKLAQRVAHHEYQIGGAFGHTAHQVGIPLRAIRNVDAHVVALLPQLPLQNPANTVEHLEFESRLAGAVITRRSADCVD